MKLRKNKKGFTIVELVIVIAVIGVLAAVLIPTFVNLTQKANEASDQSLVKNLNTALTSEESGVTPIEKPTLHGAVLALEDYGYKLDNLLTKSGEKLLWNQKTNRFLLEKDINNEENAAKKYEFWRIQNDYNPETDVYSVYAGNRFNYASEKADLQKLNVGFDSGFHTDIAELKYDRKTATESTKQTVNIRTNGGSLAVDAPQDTVHHYANLQEVDIVDIAPTDCYHEHGNVLGKLNFTKGKVILEQKSNVSFINITDEAEAATIAVEIKETAEYGRVTATSSAKLATVESKVSTPTGTVKKMVVTSDVVAIVNNVGYTTMASALANFTSANAKLELFTNIENKEFETSKRYSIVLPENGSLDGHGYQLSGNVNVNAPAGGKVFNVNFKNIHDNNPRTKAQVNKYGIQIPGSLSCIYVQNLVGNFELYDCTFDNADWDMIQITPKAGASINIHDNVFRTSDPEHYGQIRWIHIQSTQNVDFAATIKNNDFYDAGNLLSSEGQAVEVYYPTDSAKLIISGNYFNNIDKASIVDGNYDNLYACIGVGGTSCCNANTRLLNELRDTPNK